METMNNLVDFWKTHFEDTPDTEGSRNNPLTPCEVETLQDCVIDGIIEAETRDDQTRVSRLLKVFHQLDAARRNGQALALQAQPTAWMVTARAFCGTVTTDEDVAEYWSRKEPGSVTPLYAGIPSQQELPKAANE